MSDLQKLGGLWANKDKNGKTYFSGNFTPFTKILIYENSYKNKESDPDYVMHLAENKKGETESKAKDSDIPY